MDRNALHKLVEQARNDPKFLHALVFDTESVLKQIGTKAALVRISPEEAIAAIAGVRSIVEPAQEYAP
jgi:hypothetical protein